MGRVDRLLNALAHGLHLLAEGLARLARGISRTAAAGETAPSPKDAREAVQQFVHKVDHRALGYRAPKRANWVLRIVLVVLALTIGLPLLLTATWRVFDPPFTWLMVERALEGESLKRRPVRIDEISPHLVRAVIAAEDARFCAHDGFDLEAIQKALANNAKGRRIRGGSTISQQTAKNVFLWADRSWVRKGAEAYFTVLIEAGWPKRRIMEAYLNAAEWGDGRFGAEAAAQDLFGKSAKELTAREAARLAAVLPSPNKWRADQPGPYVRRRVGTILSRMAVVRGEGLDACVLDPDAPQPAEAPTPRRPRASPPELAPLPPPPEAGPEADPMADTPQITLSPTEGEFAPVPPVEGALGEGALGEGALGEGALGEGVPAGAAEPPEPDATSEPAQDVPPAPSFDPQIDLRPPT